MGWFSDLFGSSSSSTAKQPKWYTQAAERAVDMSGRAADVGYIPFQGADVAAFTPQQKAAMQGAQNRFSTFNEPGAPIPQVEYMPETDFGGGLKGYGSFGGWQTQMAELEKAYPGIAQMLKGFSKSPYGAEGAPRPPLASGPGSHPVIPNPTTPPPVVQPPGSDGKPPKTPRTPRVPRSTNLGFGGHIGYGGHWGQGGR